MLRWIQSKNIYSTFKIHYQSRHQVAQNWLSLISWQYRLWSFQGRGTKLERFLAKNQLQSNEIIEFL